ncbi:MAG: gliding motility-associated C-terminal domain-containing protein [Bacteroidetes bacterium]|nr:gliding motility-associated C-terminal domain-containing protein [Bacteroidota bacterium]
MQRTLQTIFVFFFFIFCYAEVRGNNVQPVNDSVNNARDLGTLSPPGLCPNNPDGNCDSILGTTNGATFNPQHFTVMHCFPAPSPDVWYRFRATGSYVYVEVDGLAGFNNFFVKIHFSEGSPISLLPQQCVTSSGNTIITSFPTPTVNGEYFLEIGGDTPTNTGDFKLKYKAFNDCSGCVKKAEVNFYPPPVFGMYNPGDTVRMCVKVDKWESLTTSYLHSIVPEFGPDWDLATLTPVQIPVTAGTQGQWHWFTNINTPAGNADGFFFDRNNDGNPSNNAGDNGNILSTWTGCWKVRVVAPCNSSDLGVQIHLYSDDETGNGNPISICWPYDVLEVNTASSCCIAPNTQITTNGVCNSATSTVTVTPSIINISDTFQYSLLNAMNQVLQQSGSITGSYSFSGLTQGQYFINSIDVTNSNCASYISIVIAPPIITNTFQSATGCGSGTGAAQVNILNPGAPPYTYNWIGVPAVNQLDSLAFNLPDGWAFVQVTDTTGCSVMDSVFITSESYPDASFTYGGTPYCVNTDTIHVSAGPASPSGVFSLLSPTGAGIIVNPNNGDIFLNNTTFGTPFYVYVIYAINSVCSTYAMDSVLIVAVPPAPTAVSPGIQSICTGDPVPSIVVSTPLNLFPVGYDNQTALYWSGNTYTPPSSSLIPGTNLYVVVSTYFPVANCTSSATIFIINVNSPPVITSSADTTACQSDTVYLSALGCTGCTWNWNPTPSSGNSTAQSTFTSVNSTTTYTVTATDLNGCSGSALTTINVDATSLCELNIYSGFTPNGDGINDTWIIDGADKVNCNVRIFNRWGNEVWFNSHYDNTQNVWKGQDKQGHNLPDGTYYYIISIGDHTSHGWVELSGQK